jgi:hypothetical protein
LECLVFTENGGRKLSSLGDSEYLKSYIGETVMRRRIFNILVNEDGEPVANAPVMIRLSSVAWYEPEQRLIHPVGAIVYTDATGRWEASVVANDSLSDPTTYYVIVENFSASALTSPRTYKVRVPSVGYTDPIWIKEILI